MRAAAALVLAAVATSLAGCGGQPSPRSEPTGAATPDESSVQRGPVEMTVRVSPGEVQVGERFELSVDVLAEANVEIEMPRIEEELGPFAVRASRTPPDVPEGSRRRWRHVWELDTFDTGQLDVPPLTVTFRDRREEAQGEAPIEGELVSEPLVVTVRSVLAAGENESAIRDIKDAVAVPVERSWPRWWPLAVVVVLVGVAAGTVLALRHRRARRKATERVVPPHEWALAELAALEQEGLVARGELHRFYFRLSDIVRQYIERRFGLMAPEQTTREFLRDAGRSRDLSEEHRRLLADFLQAADMVKFALHVPAAGDAEAALSAARGFVEDTTPRATEAAA